MDIPDTIVIDSNDGVYFIAFDSKGDALDPIMYTHAEYRKKYGQHKGALYFNGNKAAISENPIVFQSDLVIAPLVTVMNAMGIETEFELKLKGDPESEEESGEGVFSFKANGSEHTVEIENFGPTTYRELFEPGTYMEITTKEIFVDHVILQNFLALVGAGATFDFESHAVHVTG
jgi:hypothetical protein